ncbi:hypothetical protein D3C76_1463790 [compost metagenome]
MLAQPASDARAQAMTSARLYIMGPQRFTQLKHCAWNIGGWGEFARERPKIEQAMDGIAPVAGDLPCGRAGGLAWRGLQSCMVAK